jgi:4'-phosphopantetheinyl transferase
MSPRSDTVPLEPGAVHVWTIPLDHVPAAALAALSPDEVQRAGRHRLAPYRARWLASRAALRTILGRYLGEEPSRVRLGATPEGRPVLIAPPWPLEVSLSRSDGWALVAVAAGVRLGVDLERVDARHVDAAVLDAVLTTEERAELESCPASVRVRRFFELWTLKEAWAKAVGTGLAPGPRTFPVCGPANGRQRPRLESGIAPLTGFASALAVALPGPLSVEESPCHITPQRPA